MCYASYKSVSSQGEDVDRGDREVGYGRGRVDSMIVVLYNGNQHGCDVRVGVHARWFSRTASR